MTVRVYVRNTHHTAVQVSGGEVGGPFGRDISCPPPLTPGATCYLDYTFTPGSTDEVNGTTTISVMSADGRYDTYPLNVKGRGRLLPGRHAASPVDVEFAPTKLGDQVETRFSVTNRTGAPMTMSGGGFNDNDGGFFGFGSGDPGCNGGALPAATTCTSRYFFIPQERRTYTAETTRGVSQPPDYYEFDVYRFKGTGVGTLARVWPTTIDFGTVRIGTPMSVSVTLHNTSQHELTGILGGNVTGVFARGTNCGNTLPVGASCTISYWFAPESKQLAQATTILAYTNATGTTETVQILMRGRGTNILFADSFE